MWATFLQKLPRSTEHARYSSLSEAAPPHDFHPHTRGAQLLGAADLWPPTHGADAPSSGTNEAGRGRREEGKRERKIKKAAHSSRSRGTARRECGAAGSPSYTRSRVIVALCLSAQLD